VLELEDALAGIADVEHENVRYGDCVDHAAVSEGVVDEVELGLHRVGHGGEHTARLRPGVVEVHGVVTAHAEELAVVVVVVVGFDDLVVDDELVRLVRLFEVDQVETGAVFSRAQAVDHVRWVLLSSEVLGAAVEVQPLDDLDLLVLSDRAVELEDVDAVLSAVEEAVDAAVGGVVEFQAFGRDVLFVVEDLVVHLDVSFVLDGDRVDVWSVDATERSLFGGQEDVLERCAAVDERVPVEGRDQSALEELSLGELVDGVVQDEVFEELSRDLVIGESREVVELGESRRPVRSFGRVCSESLW